MPCVSYIEGCIPECPLINSLEEIQILVDPESEIDEILSRYCLILLLICNKLFFIALRS